MNEKDLVPAPLGEAVLFGWPWHGLAIAGSVSLVNGSTKTITQPQSSNAFKIKKPGIPAVSRTPEQLAADSASGELWTDYQLQQGEKNNVIYGKSTGAGTGPNWIGFASDGSCWQMTFTSTTINNATSGTQNLVVSVRRFGDFDHAIETYTRTVVMNLADFGFSEFPPDFNSFYPNFRIRLDAVNSSGDLAVFSAVADLPVADLKTGESTSLVELPVAVFSLALNGSPPNLLFSVVATANAMVGARVYSFDTDPLGNVFSWSSNIIAGSLRPLGGIINASGNADALIFRWRPKNLDDWLQNNWEYGSVEGLTAIRGYAIGSFTVLLNVESAISGAPLKSYEVNQIVGTWTSTIWQSAGPDPEGFYWRSVTAGATGGTGYRIVGFGFDDLASVADPYSMPNPPAWPPDASFLTVTGPFIGPPPDPGFSIHNILAEPAYAAKNSTVTYTSAPLSVWNLDMIRVNANLFALVHFDSNASQWKIIEAVDSKGGAHNIGTTAPKMDIPFCAWHPEKNLFDFSAAAPRTYV